MKSNHSQAVASKECVTNRDAMKTWILSLDWDRVVQFQAKSDAVTTKQYQFTNNHSKQTVRRIAGVNTSASYNRFSQSHFPTLKTITIARQQVDATEFQNRLQGTFRREIKKHLHSGIKMISIVEQYSNIRAHGAVYMSAVGMNTMSDDVIIRAAEKAHVVIGEVAGAHLISRKSDNATWYDKKLNYLMKTLGNKYLEETNQLANSQDVWDMSDALYHQFLKEQGTTVQTQRTQKHITQVTRKYADVSKDVSRFGVWRNTNN